MRCRTKTLINFWLSCVVSGSNGWKMLFYWQVSVMTLCPAAAVHVVNGLRNYCMRLFLASSFGHSVLGCVDCLSQMFCQGVISHSCFQLREREREKRRKKWGGGGGVGQGGCYLYFVYSVVPKGVCVPFQKFRSLSLCSVVLSGFIVPLGKQSHPPPPTPLLSASHSIWNLQKGSFVLPLLVVWLDTRDLATALQWQECVWTAQMPASVWPRAISVDLLM